MTAETFTPEHYPEICDWWKGHEWPAIPLAALPRTGLIVPGVAAGFIYLTNSSVAIMEWIVGNPEQDGKTIYAALSKIVDGLYNIAKEQGADLIFTFAKHKNLLKFYEAEGFTKTDDEMTHMVRGIAWQ